MLKKENFLELNGFNPAIFNIKGVKKEYPILKLAELYKFLGVHLKTCANMIFSKNKIKNVL